jgi:hypothetical protein
VDYGQSHYGQNGEDIVNFLLEKDSDNYDQNIAKIASYLTLSHSGLIPQNILLPILESNISLGDQKEKLIDKIKICDSTDTSQVPNTSAAQCSLINLLLSCCR